MHDSKTILINIATRILQIFFTVQSCIISIGNIFRTYLPSTLDLLSGLVAHTDFVIEIGLIWTAHGIDRFMGYGLKYDIGFKGTHINRL
ncbi:DUF4260 family protein [Paenibacillus harenae]|uniref:DUF4260 family protein n=1 Tax=Paenibacillus harenae TaxID=306543 RepID=UPI0035936A09